MSLGNSYGSNSDMAMGIKTEKFVMNGRSGGSYSKQMSISSHSAAMIPSSSGYHNHQAGYSGNITGSAPLSQVSS